jgi:DNA-cytosine methyltransferase
LNYIDLFHGIGGFALGAYWAGMKFENHFCSDIEPYAQNLYKLRFPESIQLGDITKINTEVLKQYGTEWIITGGFPCQDISIAGKGAGITGARSGLWFEYWRIIRDLRPRFAIMENVGALTFRGLDAVLGSLSEIGYNAEWQDIRASDMGAPHKRERIWIITHPNTASIGRSTRGDNEREHEYNIPEIRETQENQQSGNIGERGSIEICSDNVAYSNSERCEKQHLATITEKQGFNSWTTIENTGREHGEEGMQEQRGLRGQQEERDTCNQFKRPGSTRIWNEKIESRIARMDDGLSRKLDGDRLRGCGNAIVPQIAELLFNQIKQRL